MNIALVGSLTLIIVTYISSLNWQRAVKVALVIVILEGALRKWVLPQASQLIYFLKDFILLGAYIGFFSLPKEQRQLFSRTDMIVAVIGLIFTWCLVQAFNPSLGSPIIGILGLKNYFFYIPLMWLLPSLLRTEEDLYKFLRSYLLLLIPVALLAIAQFFSPPDSPLNVYAWGEDGPDAALGGDGKSVRVTGTFSYIAGYSTYVGYCFALVLPLLSLNQPRFWQWATILELLLIVITSFMTGARTLIFSCVLLLVGYFGIQGIGSFTTFFRTLRKFILPGLLGTALVTWKFQSAFDSFWLRVTGNQDVSNRVTGGFSEPFTFFQFKGLDGYGTGATYQANGIIRSLLRLPPGEYIPVYYESEMGRVALEIGPLGFFFWYGLKLFILGMLWITYCKLKRPFLKQLALSIFLTQALNFSAQLVFNPTGNLYHWFFNGFIFLLPQLEYIANWQESQQQWNYYASSSYLPDSSHQ